ncbi:hypothetical protein RRSWK_01998 [Rhodopirellula sp. SWK7]|nr:hypothetical protein RRSWK_01998 [Rhodopirellula sp. SWK7]
MQFGASETRVARSATSLSGGRSTGAQTQYLVSGRTTLLVRDAPAGREQGRQCS